MIKSRDGILGLAIGDAMGLPVEFCERKKLQENPVKDMIGIGSHKMPIGTWSDDTSMTLATIDSIIKKEEIDTTDIANNFLKWFRYARYTATDKVFDMGSAVLRALARYELGLETAENAGDKGEFNNGNGSLMRILPIAYYCYYKKSSNQEIYEIVKKVSSITHGHEVSFMGCYIYVLYAINLIKEIDKFDSYRKIQNEDYSFFTEDTLNKYKRILKENIWELDISEISSRGYVLSTLEATLWSFLTTDNYNDAIIKAINLGDDTDTVGACVGGLAGIKYGLSKINDKWKNSLLKYDYISEMCEKFDKVINDF